MKIQGFLWFPVSGADRWSVDTWLVRTGAFFSKKRLISEMVSCGAWARAGPHMGPYGPKRALYEPTICGPTM